MMRNPISIETKELIYSSVEKFEIISKQKNLDVLNLTLKFESTWNKRVSLQKAIVMRIHRLEDSQNSKEAQ